MNISLILASASERRRKILAELGTDFEVVIPEALEAFHKDDPRRTVTENALRKNSWCRDKYPLPRIITADTVVSLDGNCVTKPSSQEEAFAFMKAFSGRTQIVLTAVAFSAPGSLATVEVVESSVVFKILSDAAIRVYFSKVNPMDKAGAYDIDQHGDLIIESFSGSFTNIMGLPKETVEQWLRKEKLI